MNIILKSGWVVDAKTVGKLIELRFKYNQGLINEFKSSLDQGRWNPKERCWTCRDSARSRYVLTEVLRDTARFNRYYTDPTDDLCPPEWVDILYDNQRKLVNHALYRRRLIDSGEMGVGKTICQFAIFQAINDSIVKLGREDILWVGTKGSLKALQDELNKWQPTVRPYHVINYESLHIYYEKAEKPPRVVVFDESSALKTPTSRRTKIAMDLVEKMEEEYGDDCFVYLLTGTPTTKNVLDWWSQCEVARPGFIREGNWFKFRKRYFNLDEETNLSGQKYFKIDSPKQEEIDKLPKRLAGLVIRRTKVDLGIQLPEKIYQEVDITPTEDTMMLAKAIGSTDELAITMLEKLRQLSDGFQYTENGVSRVECPKDNALVRVLKDTLPTHRIIIFAAYRASIDRCVDICRLNGWAVIRVDGRGWHQIGSAPAKLEVFQDRVSYNTPVAFVAHPDSGGKGLTLTASDTIVFYSNTFRAESRWQAEDRIHRPGCRGAKIIDLMHLPSDRLVLDNLKQKKKIKDVTLNEIRRLFQESM
tara:strand:- start:2440 stop:4035 length:1596 start_codon:yes stop_codon:yes gene_type:complete